MRFVDVLTDTVNDLFKKDFYSHSVLELGFFLLDEISVDNDASVLPEDLPLFTFLHSFSLFLLKHFLFVFDQIRQILPMSFTLDASFKIILLELNLFKILSSNFVGFSMVLLRKQHFALLRGQVELLDGGQRTPTDFVWRAEGFVDWMLER